MRLHQNRSPRESRRDDDCAAAAARKKIFVAFLPLLIARIPTA
jgi:hypothetical protein